MSVGTPCCFNALKISPFFLRNPPLWGVFFNHPQHETHGWKRLELDVSKYSSLGVGSDDQTILKPHPIPISTEHFFSKAYLSTQICVLLNCDHTSYISIIYPFHNVFSTPCVVFFSLYALKHWKIYHFEMYFRLEKVKFHYHIRLREGRFRHRPFLPAGTTSTFDLWRFWVSKPSLETRFQQARGNDRWEAYRNH